MGRNFGPRGVQGSIRSAWRGACPVPAGSRGSLKVFEKFTGDNPDRRQEPDDILRRSRELALFEDDFEMRRQPLAPDADATLRLQRISTLLIGEGTNGALYEHVLDAAIDLMSADMGSMQTLDHERGELSPNLGDGRDQAAAA